MVFTLYRNQNSSYVPTIFSHLKLNGKMQNDAELVKSEYEEWPVEQNDEEIWKWNVKWCMAVHRFMIADNFFSFWHFARFSKNTISELVNLFDLFQPLRRSLLFNLFDFCFYLIEYYNAGLIIVIKQIINGNASYLFAIFVCAPFQMKINGVWFVFDVLFASTDSLKLAFWWTKFIWFHYFHADCSRFLVSGLTKSFSLCQPHQKRLKTPTR